MLKLNKNKKFKIGLVIQARMGSTRLPGKVLMNLCGKPLLQHIVDDLTMFTKKQKYKLIIATSKLSKDNKIKDFCEINNVLCFRGSETNVLERYYQTAVFFNLKHIVRLTGDNPLIDLEILQDLIEKHLKNNADYSTNKSECNSGLPEGIGAEIFTFLALEKSWKDGTKEHHREHVNEYILENPEKFKILFVKVKEKSLILCKDLRLTIDTKKDFDFVKNIINLLNQNNLQTNLKNIYKLRNNGDL